MKIPIIPHVPLRTLCSYLSDYKDSPLGEFELSSVVMTTVRTLGIDIGFPGTTWCNVADKASKKGKQPLSLTALYSITRALRPTEFRKKFGDGRLFALDTVATNDSIVRRVQEPIRTLIARGAFAGPILRPRNDGTRQVEGFAPGTMATYQHYVGVLVKTGSYHWTSTASDRFEVTQGAKLIHWL